MSTKLDTTWLEDSFTHVATILHGAGIHSVEELENRVKQSIARAEPSRGAQRAAEVILSKFGEAHSHWVQHCAEIIDRECGHVVLLEALRHLRDRVRVVVEWPDHEDLMVEFAQELVEAEAAIKQAERT